MHHVDQESEDSDKDVAVEKDNARGEARRTDQEAEAITQKQVQGLGHSIGGLYRI
jgi:hypothetical protein